jgi:hypothetical protein
MSRWTGCVATWVPCVLYSEINARYTHLNAQGTPDPTGGGPLLTGDCLTYGLLHCLCRFGWLLQVRSPHTPPCTLLRVMFQTLMTALGFLVCRYRCVNRSVNATISGATPSTTLSRRAVARRASLRSRAGKSSLRRLVLCLRQSLLRRLRPRLKAWSAGW